MPPHPLGFRRARVPLLVCLVAIVGPAAGPAIAEDDPLAGLSGAKALEYAKVLADDKMGGRKSGFASGRMAEEFVQSTMGRIGLDPMDGGGTYLQTFRFGATDVVAPIRLFVEGTEAAYRTDYVDLLYTGDGTVEGEVVFAGYGISAKDRAWDDYEGLDVKGKVVLALRGAPASREAEFAEERQIGWKSSCAADHGAAAFLIAEGKDPVPGTIQERFHRHALPALWVSRALADRILAKGGKTLEQLKAERDAGDPGRSFATGAQVKVEVHGRFNAEAQARNGLGGILGRSADLRGEVVLVGAHMDHLGTDPTGQVYNGADDNASGTATLLMLADTLKANRWRPRRTVVFATFAGEEQGLAGSSWLAAHIPFPATRIVAMINMDMTGQGKPEVSFGGAEGYPATAKRLLSFVPEAWRPRVTKFRVDKNSDHWPFYERGIPAFFANSTGEHPNYHQITDDVGNLKPECMEAVATVVGRMLVGIADFPEPLATGKELAGFLLREGPRVVEGPKSREAWAAAPPAPAPVPPASKDQPPKFLSSDRSALAEPGWGTVVAVLAEPTWTTDLAALVSQAKSRGPEWGTVRRASDVANAARGARTVALACVSCGVGALRDPAILDAIKAAGAIWVAPFTPGPERLPDPTRVGQAAVEAGILLDLTGLPPEGLAAARKALGDRPATYRTSDEKRLADLRKILGPKTLVLVSGPAADAVLAPEALSAESDPAVAPVCVVDEDTARLTGVLAKATAVEALDLANPSSPARARVRSALGGAFVDLLRRLP